MPLIAALLLQATFANPIVPGADPSIVYANGRYHHTATSGVDVRVRSAATIAGLSAAASKPVYKPPRGSDHSEHLWAPEFFRHGNRWTIHFAADDRRDENHRMFAIESLGDDPAGPYRYRGETVTPDDQWSIDLFVLRYRGRTYGLWSGWKSEADRAQKIYIARMKDPFNFVGPRVELSRPEFAWERKGWDVNEGPAAIVAPNGRGVSVTYSGAGGSTLFYALGRLWNPTGDLMNPQAWIKDKEPVLVGGNGVFAPGHNSFFRDAKGRPWITFHAKRTGQEGWGGRLTAVQPVSFEPSGRVSLSPVIGWGQSLASP